MQAGGSAASASPADALPRWRDTPAGYGRITRLLHWGIAALFLFQFFGMIFKLVVGRTPTTATLVGLHAPMGTLLFALCVLRLLWWLANLRHRPPHAPGWMGRAALLGHAALYVLMIVVPVLALLRRHGQGNGFEPFGIPLMRQTGIKVEWMIDIANRFHGELSWALLALIGGHVLMALFHQFWLRDGVLTRMLGPQR